MDLNFNLPWFCQQMIDTINYQHNLLFFTTYILRGKTLLHTRSILVLFLLYIMDLGAVLFLVHLYLGCYGTFFKKVIPFSSLL